MWASDMVKKTNKLFISLVLQEIVKLNLAAALEMSYPFPSGKAKQSVCCYWIYRKDVSAVLKKTVLGGQYGRVVSAHAT